MSETPFDSFTTLVLTLVVAPCDEVASLLSRRLTKASTTASYPLHFENKLTIPYQDAPIAKTPLVTPIWTPAQCPDVTAVISNQPDGMSFAIMRVSSEVEYPWFHLRCTTGEPYPENQFIVYQNGSEHRYVYAVKDGDWEFREYGAPYAFENQALYNERLISNRLSRQTIADYFLAGTGADITCPEFWRANPPVRVLTKLR